jgi:alpha-L-rhamnosidase
LLAGITYADGTQGIIKTDSSWRSTKEQIRYADLYTGEVQDIRMVPGPWTPVAIEEGPGNNFVATISEPVGEHESFHPVRIFTTQKGNESWILGRT